jgi:hypothetical protein
MQTNNYHHQQKPFVYLWRDRLFNRYYLGYHNGNDPYYRCSSKIVKKELRVRPQDFTRRIIKKGFMKEMSMLERRLLQKRKHHFGNRYYNLMIPSDGGFKTAIWTDEMKKARSLAYKGRVISEETKRKISESAKLREKNMTPEKREQRRLRWRRWANAGRPKNGYCRKAYDKEYSLRRRNQRFLLFGLA